MSRVPLPMGAQVAGALGLAAAAVVVVSVPLAVAQVWAPGWAVLAALAAVVAALPILRGIDGEPWTPPRITAWVVLSALAALNLRNLAENVATDRDPGLYYVKALLLLETGGTRAPGNPPILEVPGTFQTTGPGFYPVPGGTELYTQFLAGPSALQAIGLALVPATGAMAMSAILTWLASVALFELLSPATGALPAAGASAAAALSLPWVYFGRAPYSEPAAAALLVTGLLLFAAAWRSERVALGLLAGLVLGAGFGCRVDAALAIGPAVIGCAFVAARTPRTRRVAALVMAGLVPGLATAVVDAAVLTPEYIADLSGQVRNVVLVFAICLVLAAGILGLGKLLGAGPAAQTWWPRLETVVAIGLIVGAVALTLLWFTAPVLIPGSAEQVPTLIGALQAREGVPADPHDYSEWLGRRLAWSVGAPLLVAAIGGLTLGARRIAGRPELAPLVLAGAATMVVYATVSAITPDMPWALRRLFPAVVPSVAAAAAVGIHVLLPRRPAVQLGAALIVAVGAAGTSLSILPAREAEGTLTAMREVCAELPEDAALYVVDGQIGQWVRPLDQLCDIDVVRGSQLTSAAAILELAQRAQAEDREFAVLFERSDFLEGTAGITPRLIVAYEDVRLEQTVARPPQYLRSERREVWLYDIDVDLLEREDPQVIRRRAAGGP
jgi:hypothetical protein